MSKISMIPSQIEAKEAYADFDRVMTIKQAELEFGLSYGQIRYAYERGYVLSMNVGRFVLLSRSSICKWLEKVKRSYLLEK